MCGNVKSKAWIHWLKLIILALSNPFSKEGLDSMPVILVYIISSFYMHMALKMYAGLGRWLSEWRSTCCADTKPGTLSSPQKPLNARCTRWSACMASTFVTFVDLSFQVSFIFSDQILPALIFKKGNGMCQELGRRKLIGLQLAGFLSSLKTVCCLLICTYQMQLYDSKNLAILYIHFNTC